MTSLTPTLSGETSISSTITTTNNTAVLHPQASSNQPHLPLPSKKKRSLPGNPDPDAEVIALSPKSLLTTNRFICEICNKGFQRDQNLQLHRRGHNLPWKLKQRANKDEIRKKVYVCPEPTCVHHDPSRALGDLTGIKKHFCRKHGEKKWKCDKCCKKYAVQSDWKAHSKICGTREYRCDCGTLFSRRDSFITHRAFCDALSAAEESGRYNPSATAINTHILPPLASNKRDPPPWLSSSPQLPAAPHLFATVDEPANPATMLPQMSATALLQKAAEMGVTLMSNHETTTASSLTAAMCSSRDLPQSTSNMLHDIMIINSLQSTSATGEKPFNGDDGLSTRDFLGLRKFSHKDLINMAGQLGAHFNSSFVANSFDHPPQQEQPLDDNRDHQNHALW